MAYHIEKNLKHLKEHDFVPSRPEISRTFWNSRPKIQKSILLTPWKQFCQ